MLLNPQAISAPPPRVFNHSLDWRFLLPIADLQKGYFLFEEDRDFSETLEQVGIRRSQQLSFSDLKDLKNERIPFLVLPFGLSLSSVGPSLAHRMEFYTLTRQVMDPNSHLLLGFNNQLNWRASREIHYYPSTPRRVSRELQRAGYRSLKLFGAMPGLQIPEYIFDLESRTIHFALQNRFRRKPNVLRVIHLLAVTVGMQRMSNFLPSYFVVATT